MSWHWCWLRPRAAPLKMRVLSICSGRLGPHASCVHEVALVHARCVRSQGPGPMSDAIATNFHSQWRAAGSWKLGGKYRKSLVTSKTQRHQESFWGGFLQQDNRGYSLA